VKLVSSVQVKYMKLPQIYLHTLVVVKVNWRGQERNGSRVAENLTKSVKLAEPHLIHAAGR
jgi:hypothetical protein